DHVFAISGVSGGSVGASVFAALLADGTQNDFAKRAEEMLGRDFLSPAVAAMLYPDFLQRLWPWPYPFLDRGHWLEESWEQAGKTSIGNDRFRAPFFDLWTTNRAYVPAFFSTVRRLNRAIVSSFRISWSMRKTFSMLKMRCGNFCRKSSRRTNPSARMRLSIFH